MSSFFRYSICMLCVSLLVVPQRLKSSQTFTNDCTVYTLCMSVELVEVPSDDSEEEEDVGFFEDLDAKEKELVLFGYCREYLHPYKFEGLACFMNAWVSCWDVEECVRENLLTRYFVEEDDQRLLFETLPLEDKKRIIVDFSMDCVGATRLISLAQLNAIACVLHYLVCFFLLLSFLVKRSFVWL